MNYHTYFAGARRVEACIVGTGGFGRSFLAQGLRIPLVSVRVAVDVDADTAVRAMLAVGIKAENIRVCADPAAAEAAWREGKFIAADDVEVVIGLPFEVLVEATGHPEAGARHARLAVEAGKHVALVSKEVDSVVGPGLAAAAKERGGVVTTVDGDQPSLLIGLITWAETLGFEIVAAGKASEYDFVYDPRAGTLTSNGRTASRGDFSCMAPIGQQPVAELVARRAAAASELPQRAVPDLCELSVVANATGFGVDRPDLHAPIARINEVPTLLTRVEDGGLLSRPGCLDVFHCLRGPDEISFAGGVFVVVRCHDAETWTLLAEKGHIVSRDGSTAMVFVPRHLLGLEAATSILAAAIHGVSEGAAEPAHHVDLVARADVDLAAGTLLAMGGHHHSIAGVSAAILPARSLTDDAPVPFYLAANRRLARSVRKGEPILFGDIAFDGPSELRDLRLRQDARFFGDAAADEKRAPLRAQG